MNLTTDKPIKRFIFQNEHIFVIYPDSTKESGECHEVIPLSEENLKWVHEVCQKTGVRVNPNYNRIDPKYMNMWRALIGKPPINHTLA